MNDVVDLFLGGVVTLWTLMLVAGVVIAFVFLLRLRRETVANTERRRENAELSRRLRDVPPNGP